MYACDYLARVGFAALCGEPTALDLDRPHRPAPRRGRDHTKTEEATMATDIEATATTDLTGLEDDIRRAALGGLIRRACWLYGEDTRDDHEYTPILDLLRPALEGGWVEMFAAHPDPEERERVWIEARLDSWVDDLGHKQLGAEWRLRVDDPRIDLGDWDRTGFVHGLDGHVFVDARRWTGRRGGR